MALAELKDDHVDGGLNLPCIETMNRALMTSQGLRLLRSMDMKSINHLYYWLGPLIHDLMPGFVQPVVASEVPEYFSLMGDNIAAILMSDLLTVTSLPALTNKRIYKDFMNAQRNTDLAADLSSSFKRLHSSYFSSVEREVLYLLVKDKLPVPERLHRIGVRDSPFCAQCPGFEVADIFHYFCTCLKTRHIWAWLKSKIEGLTNISQCPDMDLLKLVFPQLM